MIYLIMLFLTIGLFFLVVSAIGAIRLPDFYTRSHAIGVTDTVGTLFILIGLSIDAGVSFTSAKLLLITVFIYIANPTITHVLFRAAIRSGLKPWTKQSQK